MSFVMFAIVGVSVGVMLHAIARERFRIGLAGALLIGVVATFLGGMLGNLVAGAELGAIRDSSVAGVAFAGIGVTGVMAILAHRRHLQDVAREARIDRLAGTWR